MNTISDAVTLATLVKAMRDKQREYFRHRHSSALEDSKALERQVDGFVQMVLAEPGSKQEAFA